MSKEAAVTAVVGAVLGFFLRVAEEVVWGGAPEVTCVCPTQSPSRSWAAAGGGFLVITGVFGSRTVWWFVARRRAESLASGQETASLRPRRAESLTAGVATVSVPLRRRGLGAKRPSDRGDSDGGATTSSTNPS